MKQYNLKSFELSQAYPFYWDKIEKANWFLEHVIDTAAQELDGRLVQTLMNSPVGDGGQWDMVANLVQKYGLVGRACHLLVDLYNFRYALVLIYASRSLKSRTLICIMPRIAGFWALLSPPSCVSTLWSSAELQIASALR